MIGDNHNADSGGEVGCCNYGMMSICKAAFIWIWLVDALFAMIHRCCHIMLKSCAAIGGRESGKNTDTITKDD